MIKTVKLNFTETGRLDLPMNGITVFVGPNNSGKSLVLREIEQVFEVHPFPAGLHIVTDYDVEWPSLADVQAALSKIKKTQPRTTPIGQVVLSRVHPSHGRQATGHDEGSLLGIVQAQADKNWITTQYFKFGVLRLDGRSRFNLTNDQTAGDLTADAGNVLSHLFKDDDARRKVREFVFDAFGTYFVVDPTNLGQLRIKLSDEKPAKDEQSLNAKARAYYSRATYIKEASDGVQAFTGIVTAVLSGEYHTLLIDEPEAFLHPPLARKLGKNLASLASEGGGALVASTHSADFLMGCVQASKTVRVVRLEYSKGKSRARAIDPTDLTDLLTRPLMRSANVISGLFHDGVVVLESDNDRAFYSEIYHRIAQTRSNYPAILFINAQNKQTIRDIIGPLRRFGVPAAAIPDIDIVKDGGKTWTDWLKASQVPEALHLGYGQTRSAIDMALRATGKDMKTDGGVDLLGSSDEAAANRLFDDLDSFGIFAVRRGELENWLAHLGVLGKKTDWTVAMLERLGSDPNHATYVKPAAGDVWAFMERIVRWITDSSRQGMPS
ncbi:MAG: ATP-dependent endonuclease [Sphingomicrobium sp.]